MSNFTLARCLAMSAIDANEAGILDSTALASLLTLLEPYLKGLFQ